jgi:ABC-type sugar transport system ATPase subunit
MSAMHETPIISIQNITKRFPGVVALSDVSFDIRAGEFHAIVGENGAGKSTLMKILSGVERPTEGRILLKGEAVDFRGTRDAEAAGVGIIHQELNLVEQLTTAANIFLGREKITAWGFLDNRAMQQEARALFAELDCHISPTELVGGLRVGDQQLVEIAKALSHEADVLIMDEPTSALTESEVERLFRVIARLRSRGVTILYISHKMEEVFRLSDRITVLRDGALVGTKNRQETTPREITHQMVGREIESVQLGKDREPGKCLLEIQGLSLPWPGHARAWRLKDVSLSLHAGEVLGIAGLMGAGRTELLECLFGASEVPPQGDIRILGKPIRFQHPGDALREGLALVTEDRKRLGLFSHMSVKENITLCSLPEVLNHGLLSGKQERALAEASAKELGIRMGGTESPIVSLSGGNQQKCILARWLKTNPKILLLDDPTRGIDVGAKAELYKIIDHLCRAGLGIIVTSSELPELLTLCDRIAVLCEGRLTGEFGRSEFSEQSIMEAATRRESLAV